MYLKLKSKYLLNSLFILFFCFNINFLKADNISYETYEDDYEETTVIVSDPFEDFNRWIFDFNLLFMKNLAVPGATIYKQVTPSFFRKMVTNIMNTLKDPLIFINSIFKLDFENAAKTVATLSLNLTVGIFGLFNPAEKLPFYRKDIDFGQVLAFYNVPKGPFVMVPFFGPYYLRDSVGLGIESYIHPSYFNGLDLIKKDHLIESTALYYTVFGLNTFDKSVNVDKLYNMLLKKSLDPYALTKNAYIQSRDIKTKLTIKEQLK